MTANQAIAQPIATAGNSSQPEKDISFSKPANAEQYAIAGRLAKSKAVLVQGPPGTGKTHTIANLLGHLLSEGKSVLVTAHTTKALRVLRDQVEKALQPLCLSVLDSDAKSQDQLKQAAQEIADRLSRSDPATLRAEAVVLRERRRKLLAERESLRHQLTQARFSEVEEIVLDGQALRPIEVAKRVKANAERDGWIPGPLKEKAACPLVHSEVVRLYDTNGSVALSDEHQLSVTHRGLTGLVSPEEFRLRAVERDEAGLRARSHRPELWTESTCEEQSATRLRELCQQVRTVVAVLGEQICWLREALFAGWSGGELREAWVDLLKAVETLAAEAAMVQRLALAHGPELPDSEPAGELATKLAEIVAHIETKGHLGFWMKYIARRNWKRLLELCRVEGRSPRTLDEFRALQVKAQFEENRTRVAARWKRTVEAVGGPSFESFGRCPERAALAFTEQIRGLLEWRSSVWEPLIDKLRAAGFRWEAWLAKHPPVPGDHGELTRVQRAGSVQLAEVIEAQAAHLHQQQLAASLEQQRTYLARFPNSEAAALLLRAQGAWDVETYEAAYRELARLQGLREDYELRRSLLARLRSAAPSWAEAIDQRNKPHDAPQPPGDGIAAWRWWQWNDELERRARLSMADIQEQLYGIEDELRRLATQIIEHEAWAAQCERIGLKERQALIGYVKTLAKVSKTGRGKRDAQLLRDARGLLASARNSVPVWIMPLSRVYESFDPRETKFDVVIIDEASQSDVTALAALYLGRGHVVVGDSEQVTPDAVGQDVGQIERMIAAALDGVPNKHLYDGQTSIYDLAETAFGGVIALREHFRCVPEIIQFSNQLSYKGAIRPLREPFSAHPVQPALVAHRVQGFRDSAGRKTNQIEVEEIASLVVACIRDPAYAQNDKKRPMTYGVISLLGDEQPLLIEEKLRRRLTPAEFERHSILCGNAAQFQGDERDVVFLSMVDGPAGDGPLKRLTDPKSRDKKRYNVAVSRARNQLWVVHSLDPDIHLNSGDLRKRLIEYARDPQACLREVEEQIARCESPFEKHVLRLLAARGYRVRSQWKVGAYRIDLVVEGVTRRLAVECDGDTFHPRETLQQDLERQTILERLGWVFGRIRGSVFFRDPERALEPVFAKLEELGIEALGAVAESPQQHGNTLVERVRSAAEKLREEWRAEMEGPNSSEGGASKLPATSGLVDPHNRPMKNATPRRRKAESGNQEKSRPDHVASPADQQAPAVEVQERNGNHLPREAAQLQEKRDCQTQKVELPPPKVAVSHQSPVTDARVQKVPAATNDQAVCCSECGRDTENEGGVCSRCCGRGRFNEEHRGRKQRDLRVLGGNPFDAYIRDEDRVGWNSAEMYHGETVRDDL